MSVALIFISGDPIFGAVTLSMSFDFLALAAREAYVPRAHETVTEREFLADYHFQGTVQIAH